VAELASLAGLGMREPAGLASLAASAWPLVELVETS